MMDKKGLVGPNPGDMIPIYILVGVFICCVFISIGFYFGSNINIDLNMDNNTKTAISNMSNAMINFEPEVETECFPYKITFKSIPDHCECKCLEILKGSNEGDNYED